MNYLRYWKISVFYFVYWSGFEAITDFTGFEETGEIVPVKLNE